MAARRRGQERDFNRRRRLILDKGFDLASNQKDTSFGECLLKWNIREGSQLERRQKVLERQQDIAAAHREQEKKRFVVLRDQATREPTLLLERLPNAEQYSDYVDFKVPRFMRPLETRQSKAPEFATFSVFQAVKKRKRNPWEEAVKEEVQFRPTLCPCARLSRQDAEKLTADWAQVNEMQSKSLGLLTDNRSAPARPVRTGANPLGLPSRLNSALNQLARNLFDDMPTHSGASSCDLGDVGDGGGSGVCGGGSSSLDEEQPPVFITQMMGNQRAQSDLFDFGRRTDDRKEKEKAAHKQQVDRALISIYDLLDQKRVSGLPHLRTVNSRHLQQQQQMRRANQAGGSIGGAAPSTRPGSSTTAASSGVGRWPRQPAAEELRTTCRTAESIRILLESKRLVTRRSRPSSGGGVDDISVATEADDSRRPDELATAAS